MKRSAERISRRTVLRSGAGISLTLPFLESLAHAAPGTAPKRFVGVYFANGAFTPKWFPTAGANETDFTLPSTHAALEALRAHTLWVSGVDLKVAVTGPGEQHQRGLGALLTGAKLNEGNFVGNDGTRSGWANGMSIDQRLVQLIGQGTRVSSLQLGVNVKERDVSGVLSYAGANQPMLSENDPKKVFNTLFTDGAGTENLEGQALKRRSILDAVLGQFNTVRKRVTPAEKAKLDAHAARIRDLELRLTMGSGGTCAAPPAYPDVAFETENGMPDVSREHLELISLAFTCDLTRVATVMFSDAENHIAMPFIDVNSDVHNVSHLGDSDPGRAKLGNRDVWAVQQFASLTSALLGSPEGDGHVLDNTLLFMSSDVSRGNTHAHDDMPILLAGHATGFKMGRYVRRAAQAHNDLLLSILQGFGATDTSFGDPAFCTGPMAGLT